MCQWLWWLTVELEIAGKRVRYAAKGWSASPMEGSIKLLDASRKAWAKVLTFGHAAVHSSHFRQGCLQLASLEEGRRKKLMREVHKKDEELQEEGCLFLTQ